MFAVAVLLLVAEGGGRAHGAVRMMFLDLAANGFHHMDFISLALYALIAWLQWTFLDFLITRDFSWEEISWIGTSIQSRVWRLIGCLLMFAVDWFGYAHAR